MTFKINTIVTFAIVFICWIPAIFIDDIGDAFTIAGSTVNPAIGFILPIVFYWKTIPDKKIYHKEKIIAIIVATFIIVVSILGFADFIRRKVNPNDS